MKLVQNRNVFLSAGHTNVEGKDRGAFGNGYYEGDLTVIFRDLVCKHLDCMNIKYKKDYNTNALVGTLNRFKNLTKNKDLLIDFHFNSFSDPSVGGCEAFVPNRPTKIELNLANDGVNSISKILDIPKRGSLKGFEGVKKESSSQHTSLGWMRPLGHNVLYEICFISNPSEVKKFIDKKDDLANEIACDIANQITFIEEKEFNNKYRDSVKTNKETEYIVKKGDTLSKIANFYETSINKIKKDNNLDSDKIIIGQKLKI